jgi:hypothetical protein
VRHEALQLERRYVKGRLTMIGYFEMVLHTGSSTSSILLVIEVLDHRIPLSVSKGLSSSSTLLALLE